MADAFHIWGSGLTTTSSGDIALVSGTELGRQRVLRRLLTNPGDYYLQAADLTYGAGLGLMVGTTTDARTIAGIILSQLLTEDVVAKSPLPTVVVTANPDGTTVANATYIDASTGETAVLSVPII